MATSMTLVSLSKFMSQTCEAISERGSTSPWRRSSSSSRANSLAVRSMRLPAAADAAAQQVQLQVGGPQHGGLPCRFAPAQQGAHPRQQLRESKRLDQVVVGPQLQALDAVFHLVARGQKQHRHVLAAAAQPLQHLPAVQAGQHHVQHHQVVPSPVTARCRPSTPLRARSPQSRTRPGPAGGSRPSWARLQRSGFSWARCCDRALRRIVPASPRPGT
jgi:hypothetical protein